MDDETVSKINQFICEAVVELHAHQANTLFQKAKDLASIGFSLPIDDETFSKINQFVCESVVELHANQANRLFNEAADLVSIGFSVEELIVIRSGRHASVEIRSNFPPCEPGATPEA